MSFAKTICGATFFFGAVVILSGCSAAVDGADESGASDLSDTSVASMMGDEESAVTSPQSRANYAACKAKAAAQHEELPQGALVLRPRAPKGSAEAPDVRHASPGLLRAHQKEQHVESWLGLLSVDGTVSPEERFPMSSVTTENQDFIGCWNEILTPKWVRFRHLLSGNGKLHSDVALPRFDIRPGNRVLDFGCGFGETCLEIGRLVGPAGEVLGLDCTSAFLDIANRERDEAGLRHVQYELGDAQTHPLKGSHYDVAFARFGVMFFESAVRALRNVHHALVPGGKVCLIVWRSLADNPAWGAAKTVVREYLPPPGANAQTCGPGPFSWADEETDRGMLAAAGFTQVELFERNDLDMCIGRTVEEAIDYQILVGPSGEIVREAGEEGQRRLPEIRAKLSAVLRAHVREDGIYLPSSTWMITARRS